ncbi:MAG: glycerol kinase [Candidatus Kapabacteria bacterium]|nr:glycerol kinase [Candidatus Kapabacteria bacterium]
MEYISTSALANELNIKSSDLFEKLKTLGWIERKNDKWTLTDLGKHKGGQTRASTKFGEYIVWPENISIEGGQEKNKSKLINATALGKHFNISSQRLNLLLNELGWIEKTVAGWGLTKLGKGLGGRQFEHETSGGSYVLWPDSVLQNKDLLEQFQEAPKEKPTSKETNSITNKSDTDTVEDFRKKYPAEYRTKDGHYVRSKAELTIDDSLYLWGIAHAYEKKLPNTTENVYSDFHIPSGNGRPKAVYIEYWGMENDEKYNQRKSRKIEIYNELGLNLIQLNDADIKNIEDSLQKYLLQHGIKVN